MLTENVTSSETQWKINVIIMGEEENCRKDVDAKIRPA
jgi:hypothetical protein